MQLAIRVVGVVGAIPIGILIVGFVACVFVVSLFFEDHTAYD